VAAADTTIRPLWKRPAIVAGAVAGVLVAVLIAVKLSTSAPPAPGLAVLASAPREGTVGQPYSAALTASGGKAPYRWSVSKNGLPPGLILDPATGAINGIPAEDGTYDFSIRASDQGSQTVDTALTVLIRPKVAPPGSPLELEAARLSPFTVGENYNFRMQASGGKPPYVWSLQKGPGWLTIDGSGTLGGKPLSAGRIRFEVHVKDAAGGTRQQPFTEEVASPATTVVTPPTPALKVITSSLPEGTVGQPYTGKLQGEGGKPPYGWSVSGDPLPMGLTLNSKTGEITGTPSVAGTANLTIHLSDGAGQSTPTKQISLSIRPAPKVPSGPLCAADSTRLTFETDTGAPSGSIVWSGIGVPGQPVVVTLSQMTKGGGSLTSRRADNLRGAPVKITQTSPSTTQILDWPGPANGWKCIAFQPPAGNVTVIIDWVVNWGR